MNFNVRTSECSWANTEVKILGRTIKGLKSFELKKSVAKEHIYGTGNQPIDIQTGNVKYEGNVTLLGFEFDAMNKAAIMAGYADILDVPHAAIIITVSYKKSPLDPATTITVKGVAFTEAPNNMSQDAKTREIQLPFIAMDINYIHS